MPLGPGVKYRAVTTKHGHKIRLASKGGKLLEAKNLTTGKTHTPEEFMEDQAQKEALRHGK